jgi:hypothetical protein
MSSTNFLARYSEQIYDIRRQTGKRDEIIFFNSYKKFTGLEFCSREE